MVNAYVAKKDLDSEMTVVRNEFEMGENIPGDRPGGAGALHRLPLAQLRQVDHRRARRHRAGADRPAAGLLPAATTSPTTPCCWWPGSSTRRRPSRWSSANFGAIPRPARAAAGHLHAGADPGRRAERDAAPRRRRAARGGRLPRPGRWPTPTAAAVDVLTSILGDPPSGRLYKALVETQKAASVGGYIGHAPRSGLPLLHGRGPAGAAARGRPGGHARRRSTAWRRRADHAGGGRARPARSSSRRSSSP